MPNNRDRLDKNTHWDFRKVEEGQKERQSEF